MYYVIVTSARNEEKYIEKTIKSVINQSVLPEKWIIISDGSTDKTEEIVKKYIKKYSFIHLHQTIKNINRNFASKILAFNVGYKLLNNIKYDFIVNLDADIEFGPEYFRHLIERFNKYPQLGIAGGWIYEKYKKEFVERSGNRKFSVPGAIQMFRRECFEAIGGYTPIEEGGVDTVAEVKARMYGWDTISFSELKVFHNRKTGTENSNFNYSLFKKGVMEYYIGYHPIFLILKCMYKSIKKPFIAGAMLELMGYFWSLGLGDRIKIPAEVASFLRKEQTHRIRLMFKNKNIWVK